jgi:hypothetical protein
MILIPLSKSRFVFSRHESLREAGGFDLPMNYCFRRIIGPHARHVIPSSRGLLNYVLGVGVFSVDTRM